MQMKVIASAIMTLNTIPMPAATSITLCLPSDNPAPDKVSNWLPTTARQIFYAALWVYPPSLGPYKASQETAFPMATRK